jgi:hypothetical protein
MKAEQDVRRAEGRDTLPRWLLLLGLVGAPGALYLSGHLLYEQTFLTWREGPQMVGFALVHFGLIVPLLLCAGLLTVWFLVVSVRSLRVLIKGGVVSAARWLALVLAAGTLVLSAVPYSVWQRVFAGRLATGPHAGEHLSYSAATGDLATVIALLDNGVGVDARNRDGTTALYGAAVQGDVTMIEYLVTHGADLSVRNALGQGALAVAREMGREEAVRLLQAHGAPE